MIQNYLGKWVNAKTIQGEILYCGRVIAGSETPTVYLETQDGQKIYWQASLIEEVEEPPQSKPASGIYFVEWLDGDHVRLVHISHSQ